MTSLKQIAEKLLELKKNSTQVQGWYAHSQEVRGPFCRWFTCSKVQPQYEKHVADVSDECAYAAAAMNDAPILAKALIDAMAGYKKLRDTIEFGPFTGDLATNCVQDADKTMADIEALFAERWKQ